MNRIKNLQRWIIFAVLCALLFSPTLPGRAQQQPKTITGSFFMSAFLFTISFDPNGGPITFQAYPLGEDTDGVCKLEAMKSDTASGTFAGGDGGVASGTYNSIPIADVPGCEMAVYHGMSGSWTGNFYANGTGSGTATMIDPDGEIADITWVAQYSAAEFQAALSTPIPGDGGDEIPTEPPTVAGTSCSPSVRGLSPSKPGDVISPGASYFDANGQQVGIIQERWFLNGVNTNSITWIFPKLHHTHLPGTARDSTGCTRNA
jgi:hypothetical protein